MTSAAVDWEPKTTEVPTGDPSFAKSLPTGWVEVVSPAAVGLVGFMLATSTCVDAVQQYDWISPLPFTSPSFSDPPDLADGTPMGFAGILTSAINSSASARSHTHGDEVRRIREVSGLTWDQFARAFGVSRRAAHLWATGGRMNASNERLLYRLASKVDELTAHLGAGDPALIRAGLLAPREDGSSILDTLRREHASTSTDINRPAFDVGELQRR